VVLEGFLDEAELDSSLEERVRYCWAKRKKVGITGEGQIIFWFWQYQDLNLGFCAC
jgi:hypothetical protein